MCHRPIPPRRRRLGPRPAAGQRPGAPSASESERSADPASVLADEVEAFVDGRLAELMASAREPLPAWLMLNRIGHAEPSELVRLLRGDPVAVDGLGEGADAQDAWAGAERALALRLLGRSTNADDVRRLQREVLVPLELSLIVESRAQDFTVDDVIAQAVDALDHQRPPAG